MTDSKTLWEIAQEIAASIPEEEWAKLPTDLSERLDYYLYDEEGQRELCGP